MKFKQPAARGAISSPGAAYGSKQFFREFGRAFNVGE